MGVFSMVMFGSVALGGPLAGFVAERFGARGGIAVGAVAAIVSGGALLVAVRPAAPSSDGAVRGDGVESLVLDQR